jgi:phage terminase small subunit
MASRPRAPEFLPVNSRGRRLWASILGQYELADAECVVLGEFCRCVDRIDALEAVVAADGMCVPGSTGQTRVHPAVGEARLQRVTLAQLAKALRLPEEPDLAAPDRPGGFSTARESARAAANRRWHSDG